MKYKDITSIGCKFDKTNLVTIIAKGGSYDTYKCTICGCEGKRYGLGSKLQMTDHQFKKCQSKGLRIGTKIRMITNYGNLKVGDILETVECPGQFREKDAEIEGVWISSKGAILKLLPHEFEIIN